MANFNKKKISIAFLLIPTLLFSSAIFASTLWQNTEYGMSVEQVYKVTPKVHARTLPVEKLFDGSENILQLDNVEIVNNKFTANFFFIKGKLTQVTLSLNGTHSFNSAMQVFDALIEILRIKYGKEISHIKKRGVLNHESINWFFGKTNINITVMDVGTTDALLNINYQNRLSKEADKL